MNRTSWAFAALLVFSGSTALHAQYLTEEQFLKDALSNHPGISAAEAATAAAAGARKQAGVFSNPVISWEREEPAAVLREDTWMLDWQLPLDGRKHRVAAGEAALDAAGADQQALRLGVRLEMRSLFAAWYIASEREAVLESHLERTTRLARWLRARADEGEAAGVAAQRLELEVEVFERELVAARAEARAESASAAAWSALAAGDISPRRPSLQPPPVSVDVLGRSDLRAIAHRVEEAEASHRLRKRVFDPPSISLGWKEIGEEGLDLAGPVYGIAWPVPIFDRNQGNSQAAAAEVAIIQSQLDFEKRRAEQHAQAALASYRDLYEAARPEMVREDILDIAAATFAAFEAGEASLTDVLDSLRASVEVELARLDSLDRALAAERELEAAIGRPILSGGNS